MTRAAHTWEMSGPGYTEDMSTTLLELGDGTLVRQIGASIRDARILIGWSQRELADRAGTSQPVICRLELGKARAIDLLVVQRILAALGMRGHLELDTRHLADRRRQRDAVHARLSGFVARRLERAGWLTATEVPIGDEVPRGWIDLLAFRPADRALLVEESKTDIPDMGGLQRSLAFYDREAWACAAALGWRPSRSAAIVIALDSRAVAQRLSDNRDLVDRAFRSDAAELSAWLDDPGRSMPAAWTIAMCDPATRSGNWLRSADPGARRGPPRYVDYADAARRLFGR